MRGKYLTGLAVFTGVVVGLTACGTGVNIQNPEAVQPTGSGAASSVTVDKQPQPPSGIACVILPDAASSARWESADRPFLEQAFESAGVGYDIQNANGDKAKFSTIADQMLASGCSVILITNLDSPTGVAVIEKATAQGVPVIDYDRLTVGGVANYYVSFDNVAVGRSMGQGLVQCLSEDGITEGPVALLNGSPTDNNASLFKEGYQTALEEAGFTVEADQDVPDWDNTKAGTLFEQTYTKAKGDLVAVAAANDGLAGAAISVLERNGATGIAVSGQDATDEGLQRVLLGSQCVTVYKAVKQEAEAAAQLAAYLINGDTVAADEMASAFTLDPELEAEIPSVLLEPQAIFADGVKDVIADGYTTAERVCTTEELKQACVANGVQ
jgi:D-xylose transport system substrate-binding protein